MDQLWFVLNLCSYKYNLPCIPVLLYPPQSPPRNTKADLFRMFVNKNLSVPIDSHFSSHWHCMDKNSAEVNGKQNCLATKILKIYFFVFHGRFGMTFGALCGLTTECSFFLGQIFHEFMISWKIFDVYCMDCSGLLWCIYQLFGLILTAPIHCRASTDATQWHISQNLMEKKEFC